MAYKALTKTSKIKQISIGEMNEKKILRWRVEWELLHCICSWS